MKHILLIISLVGLAGCTAVGLVSDFVIGDEINKLDEKTDIKIDSDEEDSVKGVEHNTNASDIKKAEKIRQEEEDNKKTIHFPLTELGWETDKIIIESIISPGSDEVEIIKPVVDNRACPEEDKRQICTATKGCWCEKNTTSQ